MGFLTYHKNVQVRIWDVFLNNLSSSLFLPFMGIYFAKRYGEELTGILMVLMIVIGFLAGLYAGYYSDLIGRKKIMFGAAAVRLGAVLLMMLANTEWLSSTILTYVAVLIISGCMGVSEPVAEAMVIDVTTTENRKSVYTFLYWFRNLSQVIGGVVGGLLFTDFFLQTLLLSSVLSLVSGLVIALMIKDTYQPTGTRLFTRVEVFREMVARYRSVGRDKTFMIFTLATMLFFSLEQQTSNYIGIRLEKEFGTQMLFAWGDWHLSFDGVKMLGFLLAENTFLVVATTLVIGIIMRRFRDKYVLIAGLLIYTLGFCVLGVTNAPLVLVAAMFIATIGEIMFWPIRQAYLADLIPDDARSSYMAMNAFVFRGAQIITSLFITLGAYVTAWTMSGLYLIMGLSCMFLFSVTIKRIPVKETSQLEISSQ